MIKIFIFAVLISCVTAHSWVGCSDYKINTQYDKEYYNHTNCEGYPRCAWNSLLDQEKSGFGADSDMQFTRDPNACQCYKDNAKAYTKEAPMAHYDAGQTVCLAYPAKGHVADICHTNVFIPDTGVVISISKLANTETYDIDIPHQNGKHQKGQSDYKGYQNCPKFCENADRALCTMCFKLDDNIDPGTYSLRWKWEFNPGEFYVTCWEASIGNMTTPCDDKPHTYTPKPSTTQSSISPSTPAVTTMTPTTSIPLTDEPTNSPDTPIPTVTVLVTDVPTPSPTVLVTDKPTPSPTVLVTDAPTPSPTVLVTDAPTPSPTVLVTDAPTPAVTTPKPTEPTQDELIHLLCGGFDR